MAIGGLGAVVRQMNRLFGAGSVSGMTEAQLLDRFIQSKDEAAFEALVKRFGPMVLGVCRQSLNDPHAVDDAFQATFLVLVKRARSIRDPNLLGNWLYGVAVKVAKRSKADAWKRRSREKEGVDVAADFSRDSDFTKDPELGPILHEELARLPEKYRAPIVLCFLDGRTHEEAADLLHWPVGTVKGRVARAKDMLRERLSRRGVTASVAVVAASLAKTAEASLPPLLLDQTVKAAMGVAAGSAVTAGLASAGAYALSESMVTTMAMTKIKLVAAGLMSAGLLATGAVVYGQLGDAVVPGQDGKTVTKQEVPLTGLPFPTADPASPDPITPTHDWAALRKAEPKVDLPPAKTLAKNRIKAAEQRLDAQGAFYENGTITIDRYLDAANRYMQARIEGSDKNEERLEAVEDNVRLNRFILKREEEKYKMGVGALPNVAEAMTNLTEAETTLSKMRLGESVAAAPDPEAPRIDEDAADKAQNERILAFLNKPMDFPFANETPLEDVLKYISTQSADEETKKGWLPIYIDPQGLLNAEKTTASPIAMSLQGVKARTCLRLALNQLGLVYFVREGLLTITDPQSEDYKDATQPGWRGRERATEGGMGGGGMGGGGGGGGGMRSVPVK